MATSLSLAALLSSLPSLPRFSRSHPPPPPLPPPSLPWRSQRCRANPPLCIMAQASPLTAAAAAADVGNLPLLLLPAEDGFEAERSCFPSLAWANVLYSRGGYYNAQVVVREDEPEESLLRRFKREVMKAGVIQECKRRRWFENMNEKRKRKSRDAARRNRKKRYQPKATGNEKQEESNKSEVEDIEDNWEIPKGELPYCRG